MNEIAKHKKNLLTDGFTIINAIYSNNEVQQILATIENVDKSNETFRKSSDLFAIRQFLKEVPEAREFIYNTNLKTIVAELFGNDFFTVKSIYFDKPENSNWYVAYHQDLTISVDKKIELTGFGPWTVKQNQFAVQPPLEILQNIFAIRIHLDDTDEHNGALKVVHGSHNKNIYRPETIDWSIETETSCLVNNGGIMIMKPLLLHSSGRTTNNRKRRVIHLEFTNQELPSELNWAEKLN
jgi:ectoine hydroxylase-related dioxygenase (phytanoyl-CoA dioxygenase family)